MPIELHVVGPAFGLPSIDAECTAAVALLHDTLTSRGIQWDIIPIRDISTSSSDQAPYLVDGDLRVTGYNSILTYLETSQNVDIDASLSAIERATATALRTFLETNALPLLDLSLFCTFQNYYNLVGPAYSAVLPWHTNYTYPPRRRNQARARTQHLGLSSLDVETLYDDLDKYAGSGASISGQFEATKRAAEEGRSNGPSLLPLGRRSLRGALGGKEHSDRFKLQQVANRCFEPLDAVLAESKWLLGHDRPCSADFLAFGYLSLMLYPSCPQSWLKDALRRWPKLIKYTERMREQTLGSESIDPRTVMQGKQAGSLPWRHPKITSITTTAATISREVLQLIPIPQPLSYLDPRAASTSTAGIVTRIFAFSTFIASVLLGVSYHFATQSVPSWDYDFRVSDFAEPDQGTSRSQTSPKSMNASDVLASIQHAMDPAMDLDASQERERGRLGGGVIGEVEVDIDVE